MLAGLLLPFPAHAVRPFLATEPAVPVEHKKSIVEGGIRHERFGKDDRIFLLSASLRYGLITNLDFEVEVPYLFTEQPSGRESGLGDLHMKTKVRFLKGREANPLSLSALLDVKFPSASRDKGLGTGEADVGLVGIASKAFFPATVHLNLGYTFVGKPPGQDLRDAFRYALAVEIQTELTGLQWVGELSGQTDRHTAVSRGRLDVMAGAVVEVMRELFFDMSLLFGLTENSPDYGISVGSSYRF